MLPEQPAEIYRSGEQADVPVLVGSNRDEATSLMGRMLPSTKSAVEFVVKSQFPDVADEFFEAYPVANDDEARRAFIDAFSDRIFAWQMKTWAALSETVPSPAYLYFFSHAPPHPEKDFYGAYHAAEIAYAFDNLDKLDYEYAEADHQLAERDVRLLGRLCRDRRPEPVGRLGGTGVAEVRERHGAAPRLRLVDRGQGASLHERRMELWDRFFGVDRPSR